MDGLKPHALGYVAYELFIGQPPFMAPDSIALGFLHTTAVPRPPTSLNPDLPLHIEWAILKALAKERVDTIEPAASCCAFRLSG